MSDNSETTHMKNSIDINVCVMNYMQLKLPLLVGAETSLSLYWRFFFDDLTSIFMAFEPYNR